MKKYYNSPAVLIKDYEINEDISNLGSLNDDERFDKVDGSVDMDGIIGG